MTTTTRRDLLRTTPALLAPALLLGSPAWATAVPLGNLVPLATTPCLDLYREWHRLDGAFQAATDEEGDEMFRRLIAVEEALAKEPATCMADLAAKALILASIGSDMGETAHCAALREEMEAAVEAGPA